MTATVLVRKKGTVNTDPQRRCYDGCNFSERIECGPWEHFLTLPDKAAAESVARVYRQDNGRQEFKVVEP